MKNIENVYSLSPLQQGLLFHQNYEPASRVYHQQVSLAMDGLLDVRAFSDAWRHLMARHAVLRTSFLWEDLDDAFQVVHQALPVPLTELDWRGRADVDHALQALEGQQRAAPFAFDEAPLMRIVLVHLTNSRWQMVWTFHHILLDGWSVGLALRDWLALYGALQGGVRPALPPVRPYHDYIGWLAEQDQAAAEAYWRGQLHDFTQPTPLPVLLASHAQREGPPCAEQQLLLSATETEALVSLARQLHVTFNTLLQGAWALLLGGYAGRDEVLFGVTSGGRPDGLHGADDMVGLFINTLPLRTSWADRPQLGDWLQRLQDANSELRQFEYTPLSRLRSYSAIASAQSLFESILVFENFPMDEALGAGAGALTFSSSDTAPHAGAVKLTQGRNNYPLSLIVAPGQHCELTLSYERARFDDTEIRTMLERMHALLCAMPTHAALPVQQLNRAGGAERARLLAWGTGAPLDIPTECLHQIFERHADLAPSQPALISPAGSVSYAELEQQANCLSNHMLQLGLMPGDVVGIAFDRSAQFVIAMLATLKAGACYLPLDLKQPLARRTALLIDSGARYVICDENWQAAPGITPISLASAGSDASRPRIDALLPRHPAYLIYTSGSTGQPKGVLIPHYAIVNYVCSVLHALALPAASRFALVSTIAADLGHTQLFGALCGGGTVILVDEETAFQPAALAAFMRREQVDVLKITPSHLRGLLAAHDSADLLPRQTLIFGGEGFDSALLRQIEALHPALRIFNHYGPTETTVGAIINRLDGRTFDGAVPLGQPLPNRRLYVLDEDRHPIATGVPGELFIGGAALATGYLGAQDLTTERFVADNFAGAPQRMYRTGDRVRWLANGELAFIGRVDSQVKIRGHRVELGEVEAHVRQLSPLIRQVVARLVDVPDQGPRLIAYVVGDSAFSSDKLRSDLAARLPEHMIPTAFIQLDAIALTANGKPDLRALPLPDTSAPSGCAHVAPRNALEQTLAAIWQNVLKRDAIGIDDDFFMLGGDSILSLQIIARASQQAIRITPKQLFELRTIGNLSAHLSSGSGVPAVVPASSMTIPFSAAQNALIEKGASPAVWRCITVERAVSLPQLQTALNTLSSRHQCLQLRIEHDPNAGWTQRLEPATVIVEAVADWMLDDTAAMADLAREATAFRAWLLQSESSTALLLAAPALMVDQPSWGILLEDLNLVLSQVACGRAPDLPPASLDFAQWSQQQHSYAHGDQLDAAWEHWLGLAETVVPVIALPDRAGTPTLLSLDPAATARIEQLRRRMRVSWEALLAVAVHSTFAGQTLAIEMPAGRPRTLRVAGALSHAFPFIVQPASEVGLLDQVRSVATELESAEHDYGVLRYLADNSYLTESLLALPTPRIGLTFDGGWQAHGENAAMLGPVVAASPADTGDLALHVSASVRQSCLVLVCQGPLSNLGAGVLSTLLELAAVADHPDATPVASAFPLCLAAGIDAASLPLHWNNVDDVYPLAPIQHGMLLHTLMAPASGVYLVQQRYSWDGILNGHALEAAWHQLLARHPILRTAFWWHGDLAPVQYVQRPLAPSFAWHDLRQLDADAQAAQIDAELAAESRRGFDLARAPLTFLRVFQLADDRFELARSFHHIISDGWSFGLVMDDLLGMYQAGVRNEPAALEPVRPYRDYIGWLAKQDSGAARAFWQAELAGFNDPTSLSLAQIDAHAGDACADIDAWLSVAQTARMQQLCQQYQLTPNTWVQGAWALLLARYSGAPEVLFGVTVAGRPADLEGAGNMVGLFINTLPLRVTVSDEIPVTSWLQQLLARNLTLRDFEHTPLAEIQRCSDVAPGRALFDTLVVFENAPFDVDAAAGALGANIDMVHDRSHTNYPVTLMAMPGERLGVRISYQLAQLDRDAAQRMMGHLCQLLGQMLERPQAALGQLDMLTAAERSDIAAWNNTAHDFPLERSYAELFSQCATSQPDRIAAVCAGETLSYGALETRSNRIAHALIARGARADTIVALMAERGLDLLTMMIGVLKAGAAFQPLDVNHPPRRLADLLSLSAAPLLLVAGRGAILADQVLEMAGTTTLCLDARNCALEGDATLPDAAHAPGNLAYVIFTSGSTGQPKGAMVEQRGMLNNIYGKLPAIGLNRHDRLAQTASPAFDISVWQFLAAPLFGATVHILPDAVAHDPEQLLSAIDADGITLLEVVPSMLRAMLDSVPDGARLVSLRWLMSIGEALPPVLCQRWLARFPAVPLMNLYGPAECADNIAFHAIDNAPPVPCAHMPVGRPTANNQLFVLDAAMRMVPVGVTGQICTAGAGVGRGYLNDPERTAAVFAAHPFAPGDRFYMTGDLGRYRPDGAIEFLGRRDQQVKVQGHRIELAEIESRLLQHEAVAAAAVLALPAVDGGQRLVGFWQPKGDVCEAALSRFLGEALPSYMVPQLLYRIEQMPLNANGKLDRLALVGLARASAEPDPTSAAPIPLSDTEQRLAALWSALLGIEQVGTCDNFFALGGHSLLATQLASRVRKEFGVDLPLRTVFDQPTLAGLAAVLDQLASTPAQLALPQITSAARNVQLPLSFAQQRLWFLEQLAPGSATFNLAFALRLTGNVDTEALRRSFEILVQRHEVLRTSFISSAGVPRLQIDAAGTFDLAVTDCRGLPAAKIEQDMRAGLQRGFDLARAPLLRAELLRTGESEGLLAIAMHHIVADGWSLSLLVGELTAAYSSLRSGAQLQQAPQLLQYADYAQWQRSYLPGAPWEQQLNYWRAQLAGASTELTLPGFTDSPGRTAGRHRGALTPALAQGLHQLAQRHGASLFMVLYAALNVVLYQQTGRRDLIVGTDVANRQRAETESMVGFFVNQLVLRSRLADDQTVAALLADCRRTALDAYQHQDLPFDALTADLLPQRAADQSPFFQIKLVLQNIPQRDLMLDGLVIEELDLEVHDTELDLLVNVVEQNGTCAIVYDYARERYSAACITQFDALFVTALELMVDNEQIAIGHMAQQLTHCQEKLRLDELNNLRHAHAASRPSLGTVRRKPVSI